MPLLVDGLAVGLLAVPLALGLFGLGARGRFLAFYLGLVRWGGLVLAGLAVTLACMVWQEGPLDRVAGPTGVGIYVDALSAVVLLLTATLGLVVSRYSIRYLDGSPRQGHFLGWIHLTLFAVLGLVCSRNLILFILCWAAVSAALHQLLTFFPERPAAIRVARKKFIISRIGDLCLVGAAVLTYRVFGTLDFPELFRRAGSVPLNGEFTALTVLLVLGAMTKSAQFPFHSWLPETMETPTPVSALMHAGIINAGGFLIVRLSPVIAQSSVALDLLLAVGGLTALLGSLVMLTQTDVKRALAYSTVSQMGFMMLQCGLGAFSAAVLHIVAHGAYKAHAFLAAGGIRSHSPRTIHPAPARPLLWGTLSLALAILLVWLGQLCTGISLLDKSGGLVLATFVTAGVAVLVFRSLSDNRATPSQRFGAASSGFLLVLAYLLGWRLIDTALTASLDRIPSLAAPSAFHQVLSASVIGITTAALFLAWAGRGLAHGPMGRWLYAHLLNGAYIGELVRQPFARRRAGNTRVSPQPL